MPRPLVPSAFHSLLSAPRRQRACRIQWHLRPPPHSDAPRSNTFHTVAPLLAAAANHYETLQLPTSASEKEIKHQFYSLSKIHHPDRNKDDPSASQRFVLISEAYHVLGSPDRRAKYDRDYIHPRTNATHNHPSGSHSSHAGSRPASGLSKRRTTFRGPPPSFYRNGGWGQHTEKRQAHAAGGGYTGTADGAGTSAGTGAHTGGGFGPGQAESGAEDHLHHWNRRRHHRTQEDIEQRLYENRRSRRTGLREDEIAEIRSGGGWGYLLHFLLVTGAVGVVASIPALFPSNEKKKSK